MQAAPELPRFPFGVGWQQMLFKLLLTNDGFAAAASKYLRPAHFENDVLQWGYDTMLRHRAEFGVFPSLLVLSEHARRLDPSIRALYEHGLEQIRALPVQDEAWIRAGTIDFVRRNIFVRAMQNTRELFNSGKVEEAYDHIRRELDELYRTDWEPADESWFFEDLPKRQAERWRTVREGDTVGSGIAPLDQILEGGWHPGELAIWMAYPKIGKTSMLMFHGFIATRGHFKETAHFVLEGSRQLVENRYDTAFSNQLYSDVKRGNIDARAYAIIYEEYRYLRKKLLIVGLTQKWEYTVEDLHGILREKRRLEGWKAKLVIPDYADLLVGRKKNYSNEFASQADAYRDLKTFASRDDGYIVLTAAQARRPDSKEWKTKSHELTSKDISGLYDKVRVADFLGSLNATEEEQRQGVLRLYAELYRDNAADKVIGIEANYASMRIGKTLWVGHRGEQQAPVAQGARNGLNPHALGYGQLRSPHV